MKNYLNLIGINEKYRIIFKLCKSSNSCHLFASLSIKTFIQKYVANLTDYQILSWNMAARRTHTDFIRHWVNEFCYNSVDLVTNRYSFLAFIINILGIHGFLYVWYSATYTFRLYAFDDTLFDNMLWKEEHKQSEWIVKKSLIQ